MPTYAMIVVVEADGPVTAHQEASLEQNGDGRTEFLFVGTPWEVKPLGADDRWEGDFGTLEAIDQHPDA